MLAGARVVHNACDLDLLAFLFKHPRTLLTSEHLAEVVGYSINQIARSIDAFIEAGLLNRTQHPMHAARMYLLALDGPKHDDLRKVLELSSTRQGRRELLQGLNSERPPDHPENPQGDRPVFRIVKIA